MKKLIPTFLLLLLFMFCFILAGEAMSLKPPYFTTSDQAEYEKFLEENTVADDFVRYEDIAFLGDFAGLEVQMPESLQYASMYSYEIRGAGQTVLNLYVSKGPLPSTDLYRTDKISDLRNFWAVDRPLVIQDVWFYYSRKNLHKIVWKNGNILFTLTGELGAYPRVEGDFISDLLNGETVEEMILVLHGEKEYVRSTETIPGDSVTTTDAGTVTDLSPEEGTVDTAMGENTAITTVPVGAPAAPTPFPRLWVIPPAGAVLIIAAIAVLFIRKKKTR